jgi:IS30 family transposase
LYFFIFTAILPEKKTSAQYAHCRFMEFKVSIFHHTIYNYISADEKQRLHEKLVEIYLKDAKKCEACGSGSFLRIPGCKTLVRRRHKKHLFNLVLLSRD